MVTDDPILVIKGKYKGWKGVYISPAGLMSARVKLDGDTQEERTLRRTSIILTKKKKNSVDDDLVAMDRQEYDELVNEIADLAKRLRKLELKLKAND